MSSGPFQGESSEQNCKDIIPTHFFQNNSHDYEDYIGQFLINDIMMEREQFEEEQEKIIQAFSQENVIDQEKEEVKKNKRKTTFHNFQKHLVTTMRTVINFNDFDKFSEKRGCEFKLWQAFLSSNKINKTLITLTLEGRSEEEKQNKLIAGYGLQKIYEEFKPTEIKEAQENICDEVIKQLSQLNLSDIVSERRIRHKKDFQIYFQEFIEDLKKKRLHRRMKKCTVLKRSLKIYE